MTIDLITLERFLWEAGEILSVLKFKKKKFYYLSALFFLKRISDQFDEIFNHLKGDPEDPDNYEIFIPDGAHWRDIRNVSEGIGFEIDKAFDALEDFNPILKGLFTPIQFMDPTNLPDRLLNKLIQHFSNPKYNLSNSNLMDTGLILIGFELIIKYGGYISSESNNEFLPPPQIVKLIIKLLKPEEGMKICDPCSRNGSFLLESVNNLKEKGNNLDNLSIFGKELSYDLWYITKLYFFLSGFFSAKIELGNSLINPFLQNNELMKFDIVISSPPMNQWDWPRKHYTNGDPYNRSKYGIPPKTSGDWMWLQHMLEITSEYGRFGILTDNGALFRGRSERKIRKAFIKDDLIETIIELPSNLFWNTNISCCVIIINKNKPEILKNNIYFIQAKDEFEHFQGKNILQEFHLNKILSAYEKLENIEQFSAIINIETIKKNDYNLYPKIYINDLDSIASKMRLDSYYLKDLISEINLSSKDLLNGFESKSNSIYLPKIGRSESIVNLDEISLKPHNYIQLVFNPDKLLADFASGFYNSPLGLKLREHISFGSVIPSISKKSLITSKIYLPDINTQNIIIDLHQNIREIILQLKEYDSKLWSNLKEINNIRQKLSSFNRKEGFEEWINKLPYPLASILIRYHADIKPKLKVDHLLNFFEALAEFLFTIMISAMYWKTELFDRFKKTIFTNEKGFKNLKFSTFGKLVTYNSTLIKITNDLLFSSENRNLCLSLYHINTIEILESIINDKLMKILKITNRYRNDWKGHSGIMNPDIISNRLTLLEKELTNFREVMANKFDSLLFILPGKNDYEFGKYSYTVHDLKGPSMIFKKKEIITSIPMDKGTIYMIEKNQLTPLKLLPFFTISLEPRKNKNACYFYNKIQDGKVRWISYHFEQCPEILEKNEVLQNLIENPLNNE